MTQFCKFLITKILCLHDKCCCQTELMKRIGLPKIPFEQLWDLTILRPIKILRPKFLQIPIWGIKILRHRRMLRPIFLKIFRGPLKILRRRKILICCSQTLYLHQSPKYDPIAAQWPECLWTNFLYQLLPVEGGLALPQLSPPPQDWVGEGCALPQTPYLNIFCQQGVDPPPLWVGDPLSNLPLRR